MIAPMLQKLFHTSFFPWSQKHLIPRLLSFLCCISMQFRSVFSLASLSSFSFLDCPLQSEPIGLNASFDLNFQPRVNAGKFVYNFFLLSFSLFLSRFLKNALEINQLISRHNLLCKYFLCSIAVVIRERNLRITKMSVRLMISCVL